MKYERWKEPFDRAGMWIVTRFPNLLCGKQGKKTEEKLKLLQTTRNSITLEAYYGRKFSRMLMFFFGGTLVLGFLALGFSGEVKWMDHPVVQRPGYGEGNLETELTVKVSDTQTLEVPVMIGERKYTEEEIQKIFDRILKELPEEILGENKSLQEVKSDLTLPNSFQNGVILAQWAVDPPDYMDDTGHFLSEVPKEGILAALKVTLVYGKEEVIQEFPARFLPKDKTDKEIMVDDLKAAVQAADEQEPEAEEVTLPETLQGVPVRWGNQTSSPLAVGIFLLAVGLWYLYGRDDRELDKEERHRKQQMVMDYPVILYKMSMLLGAGMTIRGAFTRIAFHYRDQPGRELHYAYEEMLLACYEMEKGVGEASVYEGFGQKCRDLRYLKFGSLLSQHLKKGSKGLAELLEQEAQSGMEERKNLARRLGEEAGTKLLLPMMLMLILVVAILMIPAVISF